jgi:two-component system chemotaxis response regulator CheY
MSEIDDPDVKLRVVLVVDDCADIRILLGELLTEALGCAVRTAADGLEAIEDLTARRPSPVLVVLDWVMPNATGADVLAVMRMDARLAEIPVVVCSGSEVSAPGYVPIVRKPVNPEELIAVARSVLAGGRESSVLGPGPQVSQPSQDRARVATR